MQGKTSFGVRILTRNNLCRISTLLYISVWRSNFYFTIEVIYTGFVRVRSFNAFHGGKIDRVVKHVLILAFKVKYMMKFVIKCNPLLSPCTAKFLIFIKKVSSSIEKGYYLVNEASSFRGVKHVFFFIRLKMWFHDLLYKWQPY